MFLSVFLILAIWFFNQTLPQKIGVIQLSGLNGKVIIERDQHGIPHISAEKSDADAFFGLGYVHAQDRLWQMEFQRRVAQGTLSEIFGKEPLGKDIFLRTFGFYEAAERAWPKFDEQSKKLIKSYTDGVNAFLNQNSLPLQFKLLRYKPKSWTVIDSICWQKMMAFSLQFTWEEKIKNYLIAKSLGTDQISILRPDYPINSPVILTTEILEKEKLPLNIKKNKNYLFTENSFYLKDIKKQSINKLKFRTHPGIGSNSWVVSGKFTKSGKPLLANDPHLALDAPALWYLVELKGPRIHVKGTTIPGLPAVIIGHNDKIAWGVTNANSDSQDLYIETDVSNIKEKEVVIKIKNEKDFKLKMQSTRNGPIISKVSDAGKIDENISFRWVGFDSNDTTVQSFININYAKNWNDFQVALKDYITPSQNFIYADIVGNIGYYLAGKIPIKKIKGDLPIFFNKDTQWQGFIPFDQMPHSFNPDSGIIATANNKIVPEQFLFLLTFRWEEPPYRINRILNLLTSNFSHTIESFKKIQLDDYNNLWDDIKSLLLTVQPNDQQSEILLAILKKWNGFSDLDSIGSTVFAFWYKEILNLMTNKLRFASSWEEPLFLKNQLLVDGDYCKTNVTPNCSELLSYSLQLAAKNINEKLGRNFNAWRWSKVHKVKLEELGLGGSKMVGWFWNKSIPTPGSNYTVNVGTYDFDSFQHLEGAGYRQIIDMSNLDNSQYIQSLGQDDNPLSQHHHDFLKLWQQGQYVPISVMSSMKKTLILLPEN